MQEGGKLGRKEVGKVVGRNVGEDREVVVCPVGHTFKREV